MPNSPSAIKRMRSNAKKRERNQTTLAQLKTLDKKLRQLAGDPKKAVEFSKQVISHYDRAVGRNVIPRGRADRKKSRIAAFLTSLQSKK